MAKASTSIEVAVAPDAVWNLIGGFDSLPNWLPYIPESELSEGGRVRHLANPNGEAIVERLMAFDERQRSYSYAILKAPFPVTNYLSTLRVVAVDGGRKSRVEWSGEFTPNGVSDQEATAIFQKIYEDGLKALAEGLAR
ncbi:SRPBCC family protein [Cupriavidus plantarum]|uniref:SRPBCC family protein n=1 Tax=Cupriavidus plantarum TaxID=942865 RepID=UPI000EB0BA5C|nr:SRPBCC family protein [Cupriavidus plantarum]RLK44774.1 polyketide cyclase/dehydrase/lipid transport protein [Cupriavidus plantarum]